MAYHNVPESGDHIPYVAGNLPAPYSPPMPTQPLNGRAMHSPPVQIGDVLVRGSVVMTPVGPLPLSGSRWMVVSQPMPTQQTQTWAVVVAALFVVFALVAAPFTCGGSLIFLLGLLFLLAKRTEIAGIATVSIQSTAGMYTAQEHVNSAEHAANLVQRVNFVQALAGMPHW